MSGETKPLWSGRFTTPLERRVAGFTSALELDHRIALFDVRGSLAHARMLGRQRILTENEAKTVEGRLRDLVGEVAGKLHTGRSRNDQVALDLRLFTIECLSALDESVVDLARALIERA